MRPLDLIIIAAYLAGLVAIGLRFARRQRTTEQYFVAGRSVPGWAMGLSLLATIITSVTFIAYPGSAYAGDWSLLVPGIIFVGVTRTHRLRHRSLLPPRRLHERLRILRPPLRPRRPHLLLLRLRHRTLLQDGLRLLSARAHTSRA